MNQDSARCDDVRTGIRDLCAPFQTDYFRKAAESGGYPEEFVAAVARAGWLGTLIPREYGGLGLGLTEASIAMEEINRAGANAAACHGQLYNSITLLRYGSDAQKRAFLPKLASGELRMQSLGISEPACGSDISEIRTTAIKSGDRYIINGGKGWISRIRHCDFIVLLARTQLLSERQNRTDGLSIFLVDIRAANSQQLKLREIPNMLNHEAHEAEFHDMEVPTEHLVGQEGHGFRHILDSLNAERILVASECIGDGRWFVERIASHASKRTVFGRQIGRNQGVQFPIARAHVNIEAADLMRFKACSLFDSRRPCGAEASMAKLLAADASWEAANVCLQFHGASGFEIANEIERKFRETRLYQVAPISTNMILAYISEHALGLPRSF